MSAPLSIPVIQSIPAPDPALKGFSIPIGEWLHTVIPAIPATYALNIYTYALCILLGIVVATLLTSYRLTKRGAEPGIVLDVILWAVPLGIVGARLFHVVTHPNDYFGEGKDLLAILYVWEGGLAIFGGLIFGAIGVWIGCRLTGLRFWSFADAVVPGILLAQAFGRFGNYFNQELYGLPTDLPWGLEVNDPQTPIPLGLPEGTLFHPTFLYESIWNVIGVIVLLLVGRKFTLQWGKLLAVYLVWYGAGRIVWESIRVDPSEIFLGLRVNVWAAIAAIIIGIAIFVIQSRRHPGLEPSPYVDGHEWVNPASEVDSEETYSDSDELGDDAADTNETLVKSEPATSGAGKTS